MNSGNRFELTIHFPIFGGTVDMTVVTPPGFGGGIYFLRFEDSNFHNTPAVRQLEELDSGILTDAAMVAKAILMA
jgi:hypothetical protein